MNWENVLKLAEFDTPTVANGLELLGALDPTIGYTGPDVRALMPEMGVRVGVAVTSRMDTTTAGVDNPPSLFKDWIRLMAEANKSGEGQPVPVIGVMESVGPRPRYTVTIGDGMGTTMRLAGATGFVTNGSIRDIDGVRGIGLPCWAAGLSPMHGKLRWLDVDSPVVIDGVTVRPGDVIHADVNGVLVMPPELADQVYAKALEVRKKEAALFERLNAPGFTIDKWLAG
jgi:4-hydroxy-4-methyl-2-oxoglutarate aldolase